MPRSKKVISEDLENQELPEDEVLEDEDYEEDYEEEEEDEELEEETEAAATLKPKSKDFPDPKSKIEVIRNAIGRMASMSSDELTKWWKQTEAQVGSDHYSDAIPDGRAAHNKSTIEAKPSHAVKESVRDDLKEVFAADETLTEEAKERLETIFEAAVTARVVLEREEMEAAYEEELSESLNELTEELENKLDSYITYCTEQWMEDNQLAVDQTLRTELAEEFIDGLRGLFEDHFIDVPESKVDVVDALAERVEELEEVLDGVLEENNDLKETFIEAQLDAIVYDVADDLTEAEAEKLEALVEDVDFDGDFDSFRKKVEIVKETYFKDGEYVEPEEDDLERTDESLNEEAQPKKPASNDPAMRIFAEALGRTSKKDLR